MPNLISVIIIVIITALGVIGDFFMKLAGAGPEFVKWKWFIIGGIAWMSTIPCWFLVLKYIKLSTTGVLYALFIVFLSVLVGVSYFKEPLNIYEIGGVVMAIISLILLARFM